MTWIEVLLFLQQNTKEIWLILWLMIWAVWDLKYRVIHRWQGVLVMAAGLLWQGIDGELFTASVLGGLVLGGVVWWISWATKDRFGRGDAMVILCLGLYLGVGICLSVLMWALLVASFLSLYLLLVQKKSKDHAIPFIPCLAAGYLIHTMFLWIPG